MKLGLSLNTNNMMTTSSAWAPSDESSLEAWYQNAVGITLDGSDVATWEDSSGNDIHMTQASVGKQPAYSGGVLTFVSTARDFLQTTGQISLTGAFTIGMRWNPDLTAAGTFLGDNTSSGEKFKINSSSQIVIAVGGTQKTFDLDSGTFGDNHIVITRDASDLISIWNNGVLQADTETLAGTSLIDGISVRATNIDNFDGTISEIQIYSSTSAGLTSNVTARISTL